MLRRVSQGNGASFEAPAKSAFWKEAPADNRMLKEGIPAPGWHVADTAFPDGALPTGWVNRKSDYLKVLNPPPIRIIASYPELAKLTGKSNPHLPTPTPLAELRPANAIRPGPIWGRAVAIAAYKIAGQNAHLWAQHELNRIETFEKLTRKARKKEAERMFSICIAQPPFDHAVSLSGETVRMYDETHKDANTHLFLNSWYPEGCPVKSGDWPPGSKKGTTPHFSRGNAKAVIEFVRPEAKMPTRGTAEAAGADVYAAEYMRIPSKGHALVSLGFKLTAPEGTYARIAPRSGLAATKMIDIGAGVIDRDYQGE